MVQIKTTQELFNEIKANLETELGITIPLIGPTFLYAFCAVTAALLRIFYLAIAFLQKNTFVDTADPEAIGGTLERWGRVSLGRNPFPAGAGEYEVTITGAIGYTVPASTTFKSNDDSENPAKLFVLDTAYTLPAASGSFTVRALEGGLESSLTIGDKLTATSPLAQAEDVVTVATEVTTPTEAETLEDYRAVVLESFRLEPQGGAGTDYRLWSRDAAGVANTYPYAKSGAPTFVEVYVEAELGSSTDGKGTPSAATLQEVRDVIEFNPDTTLPLNERGRRPLTDNPETIAVTPLDVAIDVNGGSFTVDEEALVEASLIEYVQGVRPKVDSIPETVEDTLYFNRIIAAIENAVSGKVYTVTVTVDGSPMLVSFQFLDGNIPFINDVLITFS